MLLHAVTAVALVTSITSYFVAFQLKPVVPRLRIQGYSGAEIAGAFAALTLDLDALSTLVVSKYSLIWVVVPDLKGYAAGLFMISIVFSTLGLIVAELASTKTMGLNTILTSILDTSFLENLVFSKSYDEWWTDLKPARRPLRMLRSAYETGVVWTADLGYALLYEAVLIAVYILVVRLVLSRGR